MFQEFFVNVTRKVTHPLSPESAAQIIADLSVWQIHQPDVNDVLEVIRLQGRLQLSFWDAMILTSARRLGCEIVWSEDLSMGQNYEGIQVRNPFE